MTIALVKVITLVTSFLCLIGIEENSLCEINAFHLLEITTLTDQTLLKFNEIYISI
jgi:hypothetical protein